MPLKNWSTIHARWSKSSLKLSIGFCGIIFPSLKQNFIAYRSFCLFVYLLICPVDWGFRIPRLLLCRGVRPPHNQCPGYDSQPTDCEVSVIMEFRGMWSTPSLPLLPVLLRPLYGSNRTKLWTLTKNEVLQIGLFCHLNCLLVLNCTDWNRTVFFTETVFLCFTELFEIEMFWRLTELFWHLTVCKQKTILIINWIAWNLIRR